MNPSLGIAGYERSRKREKKEKERARGYEWDQASIKGLKELGWAGCLGGSELDPA